MSVAVLERELYTVAQAAHLLAVPSATLRRWVDGAERRGTVYDPVIRERRTGRDILTWGEFIEAGLLNEIRRRDFSLQSMRPIIAGLREELGTLYPLAHEQIYVMEGRELVRRVQSRVGDEALVRMKDNQPVLLPPAQQWFEKIEFEHQTRDAARLFPLGKDVPVVIDPLRKFGAPFVGNVTTDAVKELVLAGETLETITAGYDLSETQVMAAIRYELGPAEAA